MGLCSSSLEDDTPAPLHPTYHPSQPTSTASNFALASSPHFTSPRPPPHLPPECIALILSHLPPTAICRLASVSKAWAAAAASDTCWARLLPHAFAPKLLLDRSSIPRLPFDNPKVAPAPFPAPPASAVPSLLSFPSSTDSTASAASTASHSSTVFNSSPAYSASTALPAATASLSSSFLSGSSLSDPLKRPSSKVLFQALCRGVFLDAGRVQMKVDPGTGLISTALSATEAMGITWSSNSSYWQQVQRKGSVFPRVAHLAAVSEFDLIGRFSLPLPVRSCSNVKVTGAGLSESVEILRRVVFNDSTLPGAGWTEVGVGVVLLGPGKKRGEFGGELVETEWEVRLHEVESGMWKSGLYVDCFLLREAPM
ncbi:unnamed protein product [Closterium sp. NIES-64]|nr:unnamed protein product [Closterium sp. NIES-64]